ncbi:MAG: copper chaperone PCu(A)C [Pseudomarimonas sp.]
MKKLLALMLMLVASAAQADGVEFTAKEGWIRAAPPGAKAMAGYVILGNTAKQPLKLVEASSAAFEAIVFHESYEEDGMSRMRAMPSITVPAEGNLPLAPGGVHMMLLRPRRAIAEGATIIIDLVTEEGDPLPVVMKVRKGEGGDDHSSH